MSDDAILGADATMREYAGGQKVFGRYTLVKILGRGGMGVVWLARDEELEREVALKFLPDLVVLDKALIGELKRETRRSLELTHKNIVRIYDFVASETSACISMEYIDGDTLSNLRAEKERKVFEPDEIAAWTGQLCDALDYAHNHARIIHRDLKPANLMVNQKGDLKVSDFGIARSLGDSMSKLTMASGTSGTLVYMSPQQFDGARGTHLDDIYSLGATLYDLLTGKPPFYSGNLDKQIHERVAPSMTERRKEFNLEPAFVPPIWEETVAACLAKDPAERPQSTAEVAKRLHFSAPPVGTVPTRGIRSIPGFVQLPPGLSQEQPEPDPSTPHRQSPDGTRSSDTPSEMPVRLMGVPTRKVFAGICLVCAALALLLHFTAFRTIEQSWQDWLRQAGRKTPTHPEFVFLAISTKTLSGLTAPTAAEQNRAFQLMTERPFPWSRELWALLLDRLFASGARLVIFNMVFSPPNDGDEAFRAALDRYRDKVVLGAAFDMANEARPVLPNQALTSSPQLEDDRVGFINPWPDQDEKVRGAPYIMADPGKAVPPRDTATSFRPRSIAARGLEKLERAADIPPGIQPSLIRFSAVDAYPPRPLWEVFNQNTWISKYSEGEFFEGKIVIVATSSPAMDDFIPTPVGSAMPGAVLNLNALAAAMDHEFLRKPRPAAVVFVIMGAGILTWMLLLSIRRRFVCALAFFASAGAYLLLAYLLYNLWGILVPLLAVIITLIASGSFALGLEQIVRIFRSVRPARFKA